MKKLSTENLDYDKIGARIRKYRKACRMSQEQLAEAVNISTTHLSHIETANTKLSLSVFVKIASVLSVPTDELLYDTQAHASSALRNDILETLTQCSPEELLILSDILKSSATALRKYRN